MAALRTIFQIKGLTFSSKQFLLFLVETQLSFRRKKMLYMPQSLVNKCKQYYWHYSAGSWRTVHLSCWGLMVFSIVGSRSALSTFILVGWIRIRNVNQDLDPSSQNCLQKHKKREKMFCFEVLM
jgi:hypothetical protein